MRIAIDVREVKDKGSAYVIVETDNANVEPFELMKALDPVSTAGRQFLSRFIEVLSSTIHTIGGIEEATRFENFWRNATKDMK